MSIYSEFSREKLWFSIVMLVYQRVDIRTGWLLNIPCGKYDIVNWDDYSQYMENRIHVPKPPTRYDGQHYWINHIK